MTDNEIITSLKGNISNAKSVDCKVWSIELYKIENTLSLINRQKAEILELQKRIINWRADMDYRPDEIKSEAIKEFAERLKEKFGIADCIVTVNNNDIDDLVEEMTEVNENV